MTGWTQEVVLTILFQHCPKDSVEGFIIIMEDPITETLVANMGVKRIRIIYSFPYNLITPWGRQYH